MTLRNDFVPKVNMRSSLSISLHFCKMFFIFSTSSGTTAVVNTGVPPSFSDAELTTEIALGPLLAFKHFMIPQNHSTDRPRFSGAIL